jgi:hypothetical protein
VCPGVAIGLDRVAGAQRHQIGPDREPMVPALASVGVLQDFAVRDHVGDVKLVARPTRHAILALHVARRRHDAQLVRRERPLEQGGRYPRQGQQHPGRRRLALEILVGLAAHPHPALGGLGRRVELQPMLA